MSHQDIAAAESLTVRHYSLDNRSDIAHCPRVPRSTSAESPQKPILTEQIFPLVGLVHESAPGRLSWMQKEIAMQTHTQQNEVSHEG